MSLVCRSETRLLKIDFKYSIRPVSSFFSTGRSAKVSSEKRFQSRSTVKGLSLFGFGRLTAFLVALPLRTSSVRLARSWLTQAGVSSLPRHDQRSSIRGASRPPRTVERCDFAIDNRRPSIFPPLAAFCPHVIPPVAWFRENLPNTIPNSLAT